MAIKIDGKDFSGFVDHDYGKLINLSVAGRIQWFEYRYNKILFKPIEGINQIVGREEIGSYLESENTSIYTIVMLSICAGICLLSGFYTGQKDNGRTFRELVKEYLDKDKEYLKCSYESIGSFADLLYDEYRCGLAHSLAIRKVGFGYGDIYFRKEEGLYFVSVKRLFEDLKDAFKEYIQDVEKDKNHLQKEFIKRFNSVFIEGEE